MLTENRLSKYLIYAIGEIVLVVIGILIALQINNWNEERKTLDLEISLLNEMSENLNDDWNDLEFNMERQKSSLHSISIILGAIHNNLPYNDTLDIHFGNIPTMPIFTPNTSTFESMKQFGSRIISNDSLRKSLLYLYDIRYEYIQHVSLNEWNQRTIDDREIYRRYFYTYYYLKSAHPISYDHLKKEMNYLIYLNHLSSRLQNLNSLYIRLQDLISKAQEQISKEIKNLQ